MKSKKEPHPSVNSSEASYVDTLLSQSVSGIGKKALLKLCQHHCDKSTLDALFVLLHMSLFQQEPIKIRTSLLPEKEYEFKYQSLDCLNSTKLHKGFSLRQLWQISRQVKKLQKDIQRLKQTELVKHLNAYRYLEPDDLLFAATEFNEINKNTPDQRFNGLILLPEFAKRLHPDNEPDYTRLLKQIYQHIFDRTGKWHDKEVSQILNDLFLDGNRQWDQSNLKVWRQGNGLIGKKKNTKVSSSNAFTSRK